MEPYTVDALGIFSAIKTAIISLNNTEEPDNSYFGNLCSKLINVNFDGASVMSGHISGVQKRFKDLQGGLVYTHCVAHRLELAILDAIKFRDGYLEHFDEVINNIFKFYFISAVRRKDLRKIGDMFADEFKQLGLLKNIRWVSSRVRALNILEVDFAALVFDLESKSYGSGETAKKALGYVKFIKQPKFLFYLHFMQDLVSIIKIVSIKFQEDKLLACEIPTIISEVCTQIGTLTLQPRDSMNRLMNTIAVAPERNYDLEYKTVLLDKPDGRHDPEIEHTPNGYSTYYTENAFETIADGTQEYLKKRFQDFNKTPLQQMVAVFNFKDWPKSFNGSLAQRKWGLKEVQEMAEYYHLFKFITEEEKKLAVSHWFLFRERVSKFRADKIIDVYVDMLKENDRDVSGMLLLLQIMMTVSSSTAACERGFSCMNRQKSKLRTHLSHQSLDDIMRINIDGDSMENFKPRRHILNWIGNADGFRHVEGHKPPLKKKKL